MQTDFDFSRKNITSKKKSETGALSVTEITTQVKFLIEGELPASWVRGEVSGMRPSYSGHVYFTLKDSQSALSCALFAGAARKVKVPLKDGDEVMVFGKISVYAPRGTYQLIIEKVEAVGAGALALEFEMLKNRLAAEGLFDSARKRQLPEHPRRVAIVTSPTGAALQDFLNVLGRRNSSISVLVAPVVVQGDGAPAQVVQALETINVGQLADLIVIARGGGSLEDLWCFNDERIVRAVASSSIPVVSAIGHETDFTLCDAVADLRAPTPSAAAELISRSGQVLLESLIDQERRMRLLVNARISERRERLLFLQQRLVSPQARLAELRKKIFDTFFQVENLAQRRHLAAVGKLESFSGRLEALSPLKVLGRGYTLVEDRVTGDLLKSVNEAKGGRKVWLRFKDGKTEAQIT
ncbi:MAG TPA: exodeoxyribonuclease VII large subunit [Oligoflexia bacterium]|nr:exodeoxyribonuclease VII large subunit [Oligoflexia bacterium]